MTEEQYEYSTSPDSEPSGRRGPMILMAIVAAFLVVCVCCICLVAAYFLFFADGGTSEPVMTPSPGELPSYATDLLWQWTEFVENEPPGQFVVPDPERYVLVLRTDGLVQVRADCNVGSGTYTYLDDTIIMTLDTMTLAECGPGSLSGYFLSLLGNVRFVDRVDVRLVLYMYDDAGHMLFAPGGPAPARGTDIPSSQTATPTPPSEATVPPDVAPSPTPPSEAAPTATLPVGVTPEVTVAPGAGLIGPTWMWSELVETEPASQYVVSTPQVYTLLFSGDGSFNFQADCNSGVGQYQLQGNLMQLILGEVTTTECGPDSLYEQYLSLLGRIRMYEPDGNQLLLFMEDGSSHMIFVP